MFKQHKTKRSTGKRIGGVSRRLHGLTRSLKSWPGQINNISAQVASLVCILDVFKDELEALGVKDLKVKIDAKAKQMVAELTRKGPSADQAATGSQA